MRIVPTALSIPSTVCVSILPRRSSIPTVAPWSCPTGILAARRAITGKTMRSPLKSVVVDPDVYDWEGDTPLRRSFAKTVIYEMHVAGFTRHPSSGVAAELRGTYAGMIEKIPYLQDLGITAVELLPVFQFERQDCPPGLANYWGYSPALFFAPHAGYSSRKDPLGPVDEFRDASICHPTPIACCRSPIIACGASITPTLSSPTNRCISSTSTSKRRLSTAQKA
jgi:hypothetical protein